MNNIGEKINLSELVKTSRFLDLNELMTLLKTSMGVSVYWSWGPSNFLINDKRNPRFFRMNVRGYQHTGRVYIVVNGMDLFDVYLTTSRDVIKDVIMGVYFDELVNEMDKKIERGEL